MSYSPGGRLPSTVRASSPRTDDYHTASSFDPQNEALNSTFAFNNTLTQQLPQPQHYSGMSDAGSEQLTQGSADMSIELGRGGKRTPRDDAISEDGVFTFGMSDQQYQVMGTPPLKPRNSSARTTDAALRREAAVRRASQVAKPNESAKRTTSMSGARQSSLTDAIKTNTGRLPSQGEDYVNANATIPSRNTRFTRVKAPPGSNGVRALSGSTLEGSNADAKDRPTSSHNNNTVQSTGSFLIPEMDGMTQLIGATPSMPRSTKRSSRFTPSAAYRMPSRSTVPEHIPLGNGSVPLDDDAKRVYAGLQEALDKIAQLELERDEQDRALLDHQSLVAELRTQLEIEERTHRPDSGLGSEEEGAKAKWRRERAQLQTQVKSLQVQLQKSERQVSSHEATVLRVTQERAEILSQAEVHLYSLEEVKLENKALREGYERLQEENEDLKQDIAGLQQENDGIRAQTAASKRPSKPTLAAVQSLDDLTLNLPKKTGATSARRSRTARQEGQPTNRATNTETKDFEFDTRARDSIMQTVQRELQRMNKTTVSTKIEIPQQREATQTWRRTLDPLHSKSQQEAFQSIGRRSSSKLNGRRAASAPVESSASEADSENEELTGRTRQTMQGMTFPAPTRTRSLKEDTRNFTDLSQGAYSLRDLRKALEQQRRPNGPERHASAPSMAEKEPTLLQQATQTATRRKSLLRDATAELTGRFSTHDGEESKKVPKSVRVQSPHTTEDTIQPRPDQQDSADIDLSTLSTTSRRRRRASAVSEGETSEWIIPDITVRYPATAPPNTTVSAHKPATCTVCASADGPHSDVPLPIPVSSRDLGEDATIRPAMAPHLSLAHVIKQLEDEIAHQRLQLAAKNAELAAHDPAVGRRRRLALTAQVTELMADVEKKSEMIYRLYDVVEGQKAHFPAVSSSEATGTDSKARYQPHVEQEIEETLQSIGMDPAEVSGRLARSAPAVEELPEGLRDMSGDESEELPWEGLSDEE